MVWYPLALVATPAARGHLSAQGISKPWWTKTRSLRLGQILGHPFRKKVYKSKQFMAFKMISTLLRFQVVASSMAWSNSSCISCASNATNRVGDRWIKALPSLLLQCLLHQLSLGFLHFGLAKLVILPIQIKWVSTCFNNKYLQTSYNILQLHLKKMPLVFQNLWCQPTLALGIIPSDPSAFSPAQNLGCNSCQTCQNCAYYACTHDPVYQSTMHVLLIILYDAASQYVHD